MQAITAQKEWQHAGRRQAAAGCGGRPAAAAAVTPAHLSPSHSSPVPVSRLACLSPAERVPEWGATSGSINQPWPTLAMGLAALGLALAAAAQCQGGGHGGFRLLLLRLTGVCVGHKAVPTAHSQPFVALREASKGVKEGACTCSAPHAFLRRYRCILFRLWALHRYVSSSGAPRHLFGLATGKAVKGVPAQL